jgi:hypothetical protein
MLSWSTPATPQPVSSAASRFISAMQNADRTGMAGVLAPEVDFAQIEDANRTVIPTSGNDLAWFLSALRETSPFDWQDASCDDSTTGTMNCTIIFRFRENGRFVRQRWVLIETSGAVSKIRYSQYEMIESNVG